MKKIWVDFLQHSKKDPCWKFVLQVFLMVAFTIGVPLAEGYLKLWDRMR